MKTKRRTPSPAFSFLNSALVAQAPSPVFLFIEGCYISSKVMMQRVKGKLFIAQRNQWINLRSPTRGHKASRQSRKHNA
jgi:hypothetical protein